MFSSSFANLVFSKQEKILVTSEAQRVFKGLHVQKLLENEKK